MEDNFYFSNEEAEAKRNERTWSEMDNQYLQPHVDTEYIKKNDYEKLATYFKCSVDTINMQIQYLRREQKSNCIENAVSP